jgi:hypothetical protein
VASVVEELLRDQEFARWFEFRGVEWEEEEEQVEQEEETGTQEVLN